MASTIIFASSVLLVFI